MPVQLPIPQIHLGKRKKRSQMFEILTIDGRWPDKELPVSFGVSDDMESGGAFIIDDENQYQAEDGSSHQIVSEKSKIPLCMRTKSRFEDGKDEKDLDKTGNQIFDLAFKEKKGDLFAKLKNNEIWDKALWVVSIVCGTFLAVAVLYFFK